MYGYENFRSSLSLYVNAHTLRPAAIKIKCESERGFLCMPVFVRICTHVHACKYCGARGANTYSRSDSRFHVCVRARAHTTAQAPAGRLGRHARRSSGPAAPRRSQTPTPQHTHPSQGHGFRRFRLVQDEITAYANILFWYIYSHSHITQLLTPQELSAGAEPKTVPAPKR